MLRHWKVLGLPVDHWLAQNMTKHERDLLGIRFMAIETALQDLAEGRVVDGDPATVEGDLIAEQDEIEFQLGSDYIEWRDAD